ncbi:unnamed protein product, partial [Didymodactylos carnosus]
RADKSAGAQAAANDVGISHVERSVSAFPSLAESMSNVTLTSESTTSKKQQGQRSQSYQPFVRHRVLHSVVPESNFLTPVARPQGYGKIGQPIKVFANQFKVTIDSTFVNQYDIDIKMIGRDKSLRLANKDERWETLQRIAKRENFPVIWYDEGKNMYTRANLAHFTKPFQITIKKNNEDKSFQLTINNLVRQENIRDIFDFIEKKTGTRPHNAIQIIETLFKQRARNDLVCIRNQFYDRQQKLHDLGDGRGMGTGFYQALFLTENGLTLNMNIAFTCFYMPLNFVEFASKYLRKDIKAGLTDYELNALTHIVKNLLIETFHTGRNIRYRIREFGRPASKIKFNVGNDDESGTPGEETTVADYFTKKYKKALKYPDLPCINGMAGSRNQANWLPMEIVKVVEWQRCFKPLDSVQRALVTKMSSVGPDERYQQIMRCVRERQFQTDPYLKDLNIVVDTEEMMEIKARILPPPEVIYRTQKQEDVVEQVNIGKWTIRNHFYTVPDIQRWAVLHFADEQPNEVVINVLEEFSNDLPQLLTCFGIQLRNKPYVASKPATRTEIEKQLLQASEQKWQLTLIILNNTKEHVYEYIKRLGNQRLGVVTQCASFQAIQRNSGKLRMYVENLSQKINGKLGCINGVVNLKLTLQRPQKEDLFMFMGADVTHTTCSKEKPSIAAVVASRDTTGSLYAARLCEQYPKNERCSLEIIKELEKMVVDLLRVFQSSCNNRLPTKIVFYRDGVDDGQFQKVLDNEVKSIQEACKIVYGQKPTPKLTFIVVKKRHNTRFFVYENEQTKNIQAGTIIDTEITHPSQFNFYLNSHAAIKGTSRPALYHVLHDEIGFTSDEIQQLTFWLCHTDARCSKSVSIPTPVHYAHLAARQSRAFDFEDDCNTDVDESVENMSLDDIKTKLMVLHQNIANDMWFI